MCCIAKLKGTEEVSLKLRVLSRRNSKATERVERRKLQSWPSVHAALQRLLKQRSTNHAGAKRAAAPLLCGRSSATPAGCRLPASQPRRHAPAELHAAQQRPEGRSRLLHGRLTGAWRWRQAARPAAQQGWKIAAGICLTDRMRGRKAMCGRMSRSTEQGRRSKMEGLGGARWEQGRGRRGGRKPAGNGQRDSRQLRGSRGAAWWHPPARLRQRASPHKGSQRGTAAAAPGARLLQMCHELTYVDAGRHLNQLDSRPAAMLLLRQPEHSSLGDDQHSAPVGCNGEVQTVGGAHEQPSQRRKAASENSMAGVARQRRRAVCM